MTDVRPLLRDGLRIHHEVAGDARVGALLVHGLTGTGSADFRRMVPELARDYRCVVPDLRGHGHSDFCEESFGFPAMREDLLALLDHERLVRPHLIGFSLGAELALAMEITRPGTARSLVLIGASTGCPPDRAGYGAISDGPPSWPESLRRLHTQRHGPDHWRTLFRLITASWHERVEWPPERLAQLQCPVLVVQGEGEAAYKHRQADDLVAAAPNARLVVVPDADHPVHVQQAETVNALVREFLLDVDSRTVRDAG